MKRSKGAIVSLVLCLLLAVGGGGLLTGCGGDKGGDALSFWAYQPSSQADQNAYKELISQFTEETGIKVKPNFIVKDKYKTSLNSAMKSRSKPDVAYLDQPLIADYASDGTLFDMTEYLSASTFKRENFFAGAWDTTLYQGKNYGVPLNLTTSVLFYNKELVPAVPADWAEWLALGSSLSGSNALFEGIGVGGYMSWYYQVFLENAGGKLVNPDATDVAFNSDEGVAAAKMIQDLYKASPSAVRNTSNAFGQGLVAFKLGSSSDIDTLERGFPDFYTNKLGVMTVPPMAKGGTSYSNIGGENLVILNSSKKKTDAEKLIEFLLREENVKKIAGYTGNFPAVKAYAETTDRFKKVVLTQLETAQSRPALPKWIQVNDDYLATALEKIVADGASESIIKAQLDTAADQAATLLFGRG